MRCNFNQQRLCDEANKWIVQSWDLKYKNAIDQKLFVFTFFL